jgi:hypothetical protein
MNDLSELIEFLKRWWIVGRGVKPKCLADLIGENQKGPLTRRWW